MRKRTLEHSCAGCGLQPSCADVVLHGNRHPGKGPQLLAAARLYGLVKTPRLPPQAVRLQKAEYNANRNKLRIVVSRHQSLHTCARAPSLSRVTKLCKAAS